MTTAANKTLSVALIGLDTSHAPAFAAVFNDDKHPQHLRGARITAAYPGGSPDWPTSINRVQGFTDQVRQLGAQIVDTPEQAAQDADLILITSVDGRKHRELFEQIIDLKKPVFIDKPFSTNSDDAAAMVEMAAAAGIPLMSCSSLRYAPSLIAALTDDSAGPIVGADIFGPLAFEDAAPGLFWYGCHGIEMMVAAMGTGCQSVSAVLHEQAEVYTMIWDDGRVATYRGNRGTHGQFCATIHRKKAAQCNGTASASYVAMLEAVLASLPQGRSDVPADQMIEIIRIIEAANQARQAAGKSVPVGLKVG